jgi:branched-chain amino acid transport system ATP-binding protein
MLDSSGGISDPILTVDKVAKSFGGVQAVREVSLQVERGSIFSIIGPNGAGKTSLVNMISGFYKADQGSIKFDGTELIGRKPNGIAELGIARTFQNIALFRGLTVLDTLMLGRHVRMKSSVLSCFMYWGAAQKEDMHHR